jgi:tetratricopeptide (TPR) repeat protein
MNALRRLGPALLGAALTCPSIRSARADDDRRARAAEHYQRGVTEYNLGRFENAVPELEKAYELDPAPILLFNIAQAHWKAGAHAKAVFFYRRFLATTPRPRTADEQRRIEDVHKRIDEATAEATPPPVEPSPPPPLPAPPPPATPPELEHVEVRPQPPRPLPVVATPAPRPPAASRFELALAVGPAIPEFGGRALHTPLLPAGCLSAFYRVTEARPAAAVGLIAVESRLPYQAQGNDSASYFPGLLAGTSLAQPLGDHFEAGAQLAIGVLWWQGLVPGNPYALDGAAASGAVPMPAARLGLTGRWWLTRTTFLALSPSYLVGKTTTGLARSFSRVGFASVMLEAGLRL